MKLFIANLGWEVTERDLTAHFGTHGLAPKYVKVVTDRESGKSRGFAFVTMESREEAAVAVRDLNGTDLGGRKLVVNEAREREPRPYREERYSGY